jgi:hypothetical protein
VDHEDVAAGRNSTPAQSDRHGLAAGFIQQMSLQSSMLGFCHAKATHRDFLS